MIRTFDPRTAGYAERFLEEFRSDIDSGRRFPYEEIARELECSVDRAKKVAAYIRQNDRTVLLTVPTYSSSWGLQLTTQTADAIPGIINQAKHLETRSRSLADVTETVAELEPNQWRSRMFERFSRESRRNAEQLQDRIEALQDLVAEDLVVTADLEATS